MIVTGNTESEIQAFLERYKDVRSGRKAQEAGNLIAGLSQLRPGFEAAKRLRSQRAYLVAPNFDIFTVLGVANKESAHSNFLADLLDPAGRHGQRSLFLRSFLTICAKVGGTISPDSTDLESWADKVRVIREAAIFNGRCDLVIRAEARLCVLIENKIESQEEETQLIRYREWLRGRPEPAGQRLLVFLTPHGHAAKSIAKSEYISLSYVQHVRECLEQAMPAVQAVHVRSVVQEYLSLLATWKRRQDAGTEI